MDEELKCALREKLTVSVEVAGKALGIGRSSAYEACRAKEIPSIRIGGKIVVPTAGLRKMLGIEAAA
jgi:hypothetical protein